MAFDRSKYKATKVDSLKQQQDKIDAITPKTGDDRVPFHKIENGKNKFRLYPSHHESDSFIYASCKSFVPFEVEDDKTKKKKIIRSPVFNSRVHGSTDKDIVEEYIAHATAHLQEALSATQDSVEQDLLQKKITSLTKYPTSIATQTKWVVYADKYVGGKPVFGRLELPHSAKEKMNDLIIVAEDSDEPIETDPFTDLDTGRAIIVTYDKDEDPKDKYKVAIDYLAAPDKYKITDEQGEFWSQQDTLKSMFTNCYTVKDFQKALDGVQIFDKQNEIGLFEMDSWLDVCEEIAAYYPDEPENGSKPAPTQDEDEDTLPWENEEEGGNQFDAMNRTDLKKFISENELPIKVLKKHTDEDLRTLVREHLDDEPDEEEEEEDTPPPAKSVSNRTSAMRDRLKNNRKK